MVLKVCYPSTCKVRVYPASKGVGKGGGCRKEQNQQKSLAREKDLHVSFAIVHPFSAAKSFIVWSPIIQACINVQDKQQVSSCSNDPIKVNRFL